jgi:hypothetical protein
MIKALMIFAAAGAMLISICLSSETASAANPCHMRQISDSRPGCGHGPVMQSRRGRAIRVQSCYDRCIKQCDVPENPFSWICADECRGACRNR